MRLFWSALCWFVSFCVCLILLHACFGCFFLFVCVCFVFVQFYCVVTYCFIRVCVASFSGMSRVGLFQFVFFFVACVLYVSCSERVLLVCSLFLFSPIVLLLVDLFVYVLGLLWSALFFCLCVGLLLLHACFFVSCSLVCVCLLILFMFFSIVLLFVFLSGHVLRLICYALYVSFFVLVCGCCMLVFECCFRV